MLNLRKKREVRPLSLAVLLSFNELAWIAAGAFALVCVFFWWDYNHKKDENVVKVAKEEYTNLINRPAITSEEFSKYTFLGSTGMVVSVNAQVLGPGMVAMQAKDSQALSNRPDITFKEFSQYARVGATGKVVAVNAEVLGPGMRSMTEASHRELTNRPPRVPGTTNVLLADWDKLQVAPGTTNVLVTEWNELVGAGQYRAELLNLKGKLENVVIVLDASASMKEKGRLQVERWTEARSVIESWLNYLPIQRCGLVIFSDASKVHTRNAQGRPDFLEMSNVNNRRALIETIKNRDPDGNTATWSALINTYNDFPKADTIILFTDGKPYVPRVSSGNTRDGVGTPDAAANSREQMKLVLALAQEHSKIPINVVGLGDYFEKEQANFLLELARTTGGSFLGR